MADSQTVTLFVDWLNKQCEQVRFLEKEAQIALDSNDSAAYTTHMRDKAQLLATLAKEAAPLTVSFAEPLRVDINRQLFRFSTNAAKALELGSIFYMSALLYPDDHTPGFPNDLERFIQSLL